MATQVTYVVEDGILHRAASVHEGRAIAWSDTDAFIAEVFGVGEEAIATARAQFANGTPAPVETPAETPAPAPAQAGDDTGNERRQRRNRREG